jgi:arsenite-transporting ATPase
VNYLLPKDSGDNAFFRKRKRQQDKYLSEIRARFNKPMLFIPLLDREPKGLVTLRQLGRDMCGEN